MWATLTCGRRCWPIALQGFTRTARPEAPFYEGTLLSGDGGGAAAPVGARGSGPEGEEEGEGAVVVLTATHCVRAAPGSPDEVRVGGGVAGVAPLRRVLRV